MNIVHCVQVAPHRSGLYETTRELCYGEVQAGHKAVLLDTSWIAAKRPPPTEFRFDRGVDIAPLERAMEADVHVLHSQIPPEIYGKKPAVLVLHGAPEYVFYSQLFGHKEGDGGYRTLIDYSKETFFKRFVTFWPRHAEYWKSIFGDSKVLVCPPPVSTEDYSPNGVKHTFSKVGTPNIGYCDTWRPTFFKDPFQILAGVRTYWREYNKQAKLQIIGIPAESTRMKDWGGVWDKHILAVRRNGDFFGDLHEMHPRMSEVYRSLDMVITATADASRVLREALASGVPVIAPHGCKFTKYTCDIANPTAIAKTIADVWTDVQNSREDVSTLCLEMAAGFNLSSSVSAFVSVLEQAVKEGI